MFEVSLTYMMCVEGWLYFRLQATVVILADFLWFLFFYVCGSGWDKTRYLYILGYCGEHLNTEVIQVITRNMTVFWLVAACSQGALMMELASTSETSVNIYQTTRRNNSEDGQVQIRRRENLKCHI
jgi:hypothetical protein